MHDKHIIMFHKLYFSWLKTESSHNPLYNTVPFFEKKNQKPKNKQTTKVMYKNKVCKK